MCTNPRCNGTDWLCGKCRKIYPSLAAALDTRKRERRDSFKRDLPNGTTIYGPKSTEGRPGHRHGHRGKNFDRSPHSSLGSAAVGDPHNYEEHKTKRTKRW
ncbi:hypothetical protein FEK35_15045 [Nocardia cyriacigeorgica]|uniref:Uncharacterized protein n=1 Tax=Nocardia cyriacigeorgica TaxID=135487 RepID=A0A5R8PES1_9NOCA|nr:hypothetical protein [Nocardia cyriacigeorgica]TLG09440.1 hypothetical protein FEK35_15045 [Nocardia cyriacigeorgica]